MAAKLLANLLIMGSGVLGRAVFQAYRKALEKIDKPDTVELEVGGVTVHAVASTFQACGNGNSTDANKTGVAHETIQNIRRAGKAMTEQEARQVLGISEQSTWEEILQKYDTLFEKNAKNGSFYLQSKVHRAKECLGAVYQVKE